MDAWIPSIVTALTAVFVALVVGVITLTAYKRGVMQGMKLAQLVWQIHADVEPTVEAMDSIDRQEITGPTETE